MYATDESSRTLWSDRAVKVPEAVCPSYPVSSYRDDTSRGRPKPPSLTKASLKAPILCILSLVDVLEDSLKPIYLPTP